MKPIVEIIIVNWNHRNYLGSCLEAIRAQTYPNLEITIIDNGSVDHSLDWLAQNYPQLHVFAFNENRGFSVGFNHAVHHTTGPFILSLNPDVVVQPDFVAELVQAMDMDQQIGIVAPKLLRADNPALLDSTGLFLDHRRRPYDRGQLHEDLGQYDTQEEVFGACGAAAFYRRGMLEDLALDGEYFDEDFFAYYEDVDLAWRAQARGWRAVYAPKAIATHVRGWGDTLRKCREKREWKGLRLAICNRYLTIVKNDAIRYFIVDMPQILVTEIPRLAYLAVKQPSTLLGFVDFFQKLSSIRCKRKQIRDRQLVDDTRIRQWFVQPY